MGCSNPSSFFYSNYMKRCKGKNMHWLSIIQCFEDQFIFYGSFNFLKSLCKLTFPTDNSSFIKSFRYCHAQNLKEKHTQFFFFFFLYKINKLISLAFTKDNYISSKVKILRGIKLLNLNSRYYHNIVIGFINAFLISN